jgi:hypothetical protein
METCRAIEYGRKIEALLLGIGGKLPENAVP